MGYTVTAGANGRKPHSIVVCRRRPPISSPTRYRLTLRHSRRPTARRTRHGASLRERRGRRRLPGPDPLPARRRRRPPRLVGGAGQRGGGAGRARPMAAAQRSPGRRRGATVPLAQQRRSSSPASGTDRGSCLEGWTTRSASSVTTFPATGALHPLAPHRARVLPLRADRRAHGHARDGHALRLLRVQVTPRRTGPALIAGQMWLDSTTAEVVRLTFRYVGTALWVRPEDGPRGPDSARRAASTRSPTGWSASTPTWSTRCRTAASGCRIARCSRAESASPCSSDLVIPFQATTMFDDFEINGGRAIVFDLPLPDTTGMSRDSLRALRRARMDSLQAERRGRSDEAADSLRSWDYADLWAGGRYELHRPSNVARALPGVARLALDGGRSRRRPTAARGRDRARAAGRRRCPTAHWAVPRGLAFERLADLLRYDRVQGLSLGLGYRVRAPAVRSPTSTGPCATASAIDRVTGRLSFVRDAPGGRLTVSGYRDVVDVDPFSAGRTVGNTLNALFVAHDNAGLRSGSGRIGSVRDVSVAPVSTWPRADGWSGSARVAPPGRVGCQRLARRRRHLSAQPSGGRGHVRRRVGAAREPVGRHPLEPHRRRARRARRERPGRLFGEVRKDVGDGAGRRSAQGRRSPPAPRSASRLFRLGGLERRCAASTTARGPGRRSGPPSSTLRRSAGVSGRSRSWTRDRRTAPAISSRARRSRGRGRALALRRRAPVRPEPSDLAGQRRQGAVRPRAAGAAVSLGPGGLAVVLAGWRSRARRRQSSTPGRGSTSRWTGRYRRHGGPRLATAEWCDSLRPLEIRRVSRRQRHRASRSTPRARHPAGQLSHRSPEQRPCRHRPSAAVGARWFSADVDAGFQSDSGGSSSRGPRTGRARGRFTRPRIAATGKGPSSLDGSFEGLARATGHAGLHDACRGPAAGRPPRLRPGID